MKRFRSSRTIIGLVLILFLLYPYSLSAADSRTTQGKKLIIAVSILPMAYFAERLAGEGVEVIVLVGSGQNPHSYEPSPRQMALLGSAELWFTIGVDFEKALVPKISALYPRMRIIDASRRVKFRPMDEHGEGDEHENGGRDQHVWLGREQAGQIGMNMSEALSEADPRGKTIYNANLVVFVREIEEAFGNLAKDLLPLKGKPVFVYHPSFGYFLDEFGIEQVAVETGGKEPTQKGLAALVARAKASGARAIFVQAQFPAGAARTLAAAIGGSVVSIDPLARDWLSNLKRMGEALKRAAVP